MNKKYLIAYILILFVTLSYGQDTRKLYDPSANAREDIEKCIAQAKKERKHVLLQMGGDWCKWCHRFDAFSKSDSTVASILKQSYVVYHFNYDKKSKDAALLEKYGHPERFGFPVLLVLDDEGKLLHTQSSWFLEDGKDSYNSQLVQHFLKMWTPKAVDPKTYSQVDKAMSKLRTF